MIFGIAEAVPTDQCTNLKCQVVESLWELLDGHTLRPTVYHHQVDGITERFNRTIKMLTQFVQQKEQDDWDLKLDYRLLTKQQYTQQLNARLSYSFSDTSPNYQSIWCLTKQMRRI